MGGEKVESYKIQNVSFTYPNRTEKTLDNINFSVNSGEFICLCGKSGCGKTTLLRLLKTVLTPYGTLAGDIIFEGKNLSEIDISTQAAKIGFVMQNIDNQIVTDKVWHELAFGLESLGVSTSEIRTRVSEMVSFFGIGEWFHKNISELSGGQKQLLNLASVMVMQPSILILDEPTSQLDPIAAGEFLKTLEKINDEFGTTIILSEHRLEEAFPISDRVIVMDNGTIIADGKPNEVGKILKDKNHDMYMALPTPMRVFGYLDRGSDFPITVRQGRIWLEKFSQNNKANPDLIPTTQKANSNEVCLELKDVWFRYEKDLPDVVRAVNLKVNKGEIFSVLGSNGSGKTTTLSLISGLNTPYRGKVFINGRKLSDIKNIYNGILGVLPQNPQSLFTKNTVYLDLLEMLSDSELTKLEKEEKIKNIVHLCRMHDKLDYHPYDLSGGEQQRAALCKVLLKSPEILLLDEPTKGLDSHFKKIFADILLDLKLSGKTVVMVSHDIEFCASVSDRCSMFFDGSITSTSSPREFFAGNNFYTTSANRMARNILPKAVLAKDIVLAFGKTICEEKVDKTDVYKPPEIKKEDDIKNFSKKLSPVRITLGCVFAFLFVVFSIIKVSKFINFDIGAIQLISVISLGGSFMCFFRKKDIGVSVQMPKNKRRLTKRTLVSIFLILLAIPLTIFAGVLYLGDKKYYIISLIVILETFIPFCMVFEDRKMQARELVIISVLCAISVCGRTAFFSLPQFKPVAALVIISGVCFGAESGFLVGAITGFVSNFFFGQGPWTPWQMFGFGVLGFLAGILFRKGWIRKNRTSLCVFGFFTAIIIYGGIVNIATVLISQTTLSVEMIIKACIAGLPIDLIHGVSTAFFLWFISETMIEKLERIKVKYGLIER